MDSVIRECGKDGCRKSIHIEVLPYKFITLTQKDNPSSATFITTTLLFGISPNPSQQLDLSELVSPTFYYRPVTLQNTVQHYGPPE